MIDNVEKRRNTMKRFLSIIVMIMLVVFAMTVSVNALSFTATMTPSATTVDESTEFTVTIKVSNLDVGTNGINSLKGYLKYDTEVFDTISESSIEGLNSWTAKYDATTGKIELTKNTFVTSTQEVFQIAFKTKSGVSGKSGTISYSNIVASNSESDISATDISTSITVGTASNSENTVQNIAQGNTAVAPIINATTNSNNRNNVVNNTNVATNNTTNNTVSQYVNTTSETDMPKTGVDDTLLALVFVAIAVAMIFYVKIEKLNKDMK